MEIGKAIVNYDSDGRLFEVRFTHTMQINLTNNKAAKLAKIDGSSIETLESTASFVLSSWFKRIGQVEVDKIITKAIDPKIWDNGQIKQCTVLFYLEKDFGSSES